MPVLPPPPPSRPEVVDWARTHLGHLSGDEVRPAPSRGGQSAADAALAGLDITGYARTRSQVLPVEHRGATRLSPYIRHGLLPLPTVWAAVAAAPRADRDKFRAELLWQEYARHVYARLGRRMAQPLRFAAPVTRERWEGEPWRQDMACIAECTRELAEEGWLVNQTRMWLASQWAVRAGADWQTGERELYRQLLDGSPAANRLGWQWTVGTGTGKVYGFSRWQVEKRAPGLCRSCELRDHCPVQDWPDADAGPRVEPPDGLAGGPTDAGPRRVERSGEPELVWLTAESLGDEDPALAAHPELPAVFVLDEPLLAGLRLSGKRLVFLAECLAELALRPAGLEVRLGDPVTELADRPLAATWTYVPGWKRRSAQLDLAEVHPWPWLRRPGSGSLRSYSAWDKASSRNGR